MSTIERPIAGTPCWIDLVGCDATAARAFNGELLSVPTSAENAG